MEKILKLFGVKTHTFKITLSVGETKVQVEAAASSQSELMEALRAADAIVTTVKQEEKLL